MKKRSKLIVALGFCRKWLNNRVMKEEKEIERAILGKNKHFQPGFELEMDQPEKTKE